MNTQTSTHTPPPPFLLALFSLVALVAAMVLMATACTPAPRDEYPDEQCGDGIVADVEECDGQPVHCSWVGAAAPVGGVDGWVPCDPERCHGHWALCNYDCPAGTLGCPCQDSCIEGECLPFDDVSKTCQ